MLKGIAPIIGPDLLNALYRMGHSHEIAFIDANCPTPPDHSNVVRADGVSLLDLLAAALELLPIDDIGDDAICRSSVRGDPSIMAPVYAEVEALCARLAPGKSVRPLSNEEFGLRLGAAHTVVVTGERRLYANIVIRKGVIGPDIGGHE